MKPIVTALVGMCGTGKSVAADYIENNFPFKSVYFGGFVLEEVKRRGLEINSLNEKTVREDLRAQHGLGVMAKLAEPKIDAHLTEGSNVIIDGLYSFSEYTFLKEKYGTNLVMIAIHASRRLRHERLGIRKVRPLTQEQVDERDLLEIQNIEKAGPIAISDYPILNNGTIPELEKELTFYINEILKR